LNRSIYIRKFFAVLLLANFALSNTPTKYLHWLFANHTDFISKTLTDSNTPQINAAGIDCHCITNVVIAPFTMGSSLVIQAPVSVFPGYTIAAVQQIPFLQSFSFGVRGPPAVA